MRLLKTLCLSLLPLLAIGQELNSAQFTSRLLDMVEQQPEAFFDVSILLSDQLAVWDLHLEYDQRGWTQAQRVQDLLPKLKEKAATTQVPVLNLLQQAGEAVEAGSIRRFWVANMLFAKVKRSVLVDLSNRADVQLLDWNAPLELVESVDEGPAPPVVPNGIEPGLAAIHAPALWAMGYTGYGTLNFVNDTGVDPDHPALYAQYRGLYRSDSESWFEFQGANNGPYDCDDHGTHVAGIMQGLNRATNDTTGVAFNSQWIGGAILCGIGTADNVAAFQWALDPDDNPDTVDDMPHVINNSWRDSSLDDDCNSVYVNILNSLEAAGIAVVFSAGNEGPGEQTITPPHNINTDLVNVFCVGSLNANTASLSIANSSSRGPSNCGGDSSLLIKPEVSAPGVTVRSSVPGGGYGNKSGTSMASPHVAGAILLLKEAFPDLLGYQLKEALYFTCTDLGLPGEDNTFGMGIINVEAAFNYLVNEGHVPVDPHVQNDVQLVRLQFEPFQCDYSIFGRAQVENAGTMPLTSFICQVTLEDGTIWETTWTGDLPSGERTWVDLGPIAADLGSEFLKVEVDLPNAVDDERPLNNRLFQEVEIDDRSFLDAFLAQDENMYYCEGGEALLKVNYNGGGTIEVDWYDAPVDGNLLGSGQAFSLGGLTESTTVYAAATYHENIGMANPYLGAFEFESDNQERGLVFDALKPFYLRRVKLYTESTGALIIELADSQGETLAQKVVVLNEIGENLVNIDLLVPEGNNLQLQVQAGISLAYSSTGMTFPYIIEDVVRLEKSNFPSGSGGLGRYNYFYDWEIEYDEFCSRTPVEIPYFDAGILPVAAFSASATLLDLDNGDGNVAFTDDSQNASAWFWDFGDGTSSTAQNPNHTYETPGIYFASLTVASPDGCTDHSFVQIEAFTTPVSGLTESGASDLVFELFPNPAKTAVTLVWGANSASTGLQVQLLDLFGRQVWSGPLQLKGAEGSLEVDVTSLSGGVYWVLVRDGRQQYTKKLVIAE